MKTHLADALKNAPCDFAEFRYQETTATTLTFDGKGIKNIGVHRERGCFARALVNGRFGVASFEDASRAREFLNKAIAMAKLRPGKALKLAPAPPAVDDIVIEVPRAAHTVDLNEKVEAVSRYNAILLANKRVPGTMTRYADYYQYDVYVNTEGAAISMARPRLGLSLRPLASEGGVVQLAIKNIGGIVGFDHILGREAEAEKVAAHAASLLDAEPATGGTYDVITDPILTGVFAHEAFGHTAEADEIFEDEKLREIMTPGNRLGADILSIIDDGTYAGHNGFTPYDDEGVPGQRNYLIKEGVLAGLLHNRETAATWGVAPTGNARALNYRFPPLIRMTATFVGGGATPFKEMLSSVARGIYARGAKGGTGGETFSFTAEDGYLIENGKLTKHLRDLKLQGNLFRTLANIAAVGDDFKMPEEGAGGCGKWNQSPLPVSSGGPHMLIHGVQVGGR